MKGKSHFSRRLGAYSVAAGAAALGAASTAQAGLNVFDHRSAPINPIVEYFLFDQTMMVMNVKTGDFQYVVETGVNTDGVNEVDRFNQAGFVDNNLIPDVDLTDDTVYFKHRDVDVDVGWGPKPGDVTALETPTGGAAGTLDAAQGPVYTPSGGTANDWYWADQSGTTSPYPTDGSSAGTIDGTLSFNNASPTGYTGVVTHGFGGLGHGSGSSFGVYPNPSAVGFQLEEVDGTHSGWVALRHNEDRNRIWVDGWAYQTTPYAPADLTWDADPGIVGDFDGDGDVDADDVDILCANMGGALDPYDLDGDSDVDEEDMILLVTTLIEWDNGVTNGTGTYRGDFNLDGVVNATDLQIMKDNFGTSGVGYALGNANCDTVVNATDLQIMKDNFGSVASAVPEPLTIGLLAVDGAALLRRRK